MLPGHTPEGLAQLDVIVRRLQDFAVMDWDLVLAVAVFGVVLLHGEVLGFQGRDQVVREPGGLGHAYRREAEGAVERHVSALMVASGERELGLESGGELPTPFGGPGAYAFQERARACSPGGAVGG